jgi:tetratricopeptide (TPR) repeat protein
MKQRILILASLLTFCSAAWSGDLDQIKQLIQANENKLALEKIDNLPANQPKKADVLFLRAVALSKLNRRQEAIDVYNELINKYPTLPEPRNNLAVLYAQQGKFEASEQALQSALNTDPSYATAQRNLSDIYKTLASIAYNKALSLDNGKEPAPPETKLSLIEELRSYHENAPAAPAVAMVKAVASVTNVEPTSRPDFEKPADINDIKRDIKDVIDNWADAWSKQDVEAYLEHYSPDFTPDDHTSLTEWQNQRRQRLKAPGFIRVEVRKLNTMLLDKHIASATFDQRYRSDRFSDLSHKMLILKQEQGQWRIIQETETK